MRNGYRRFGDKYQKKRQMGKIMTNRNEWKQIGDAWRQTMTTVKNGGK